MSLRIRSMYQNWICHCIKMLNFQLLYISMPKGESRTEKPPSSQCHLHPFKCPILLTLPSLTPVSRGSSLLFPWHSWAKQQGEAAALSLLPMDDGESSLVPSHQGCRQLVIQQDSHSPPGSRRNACGVWLGRGQKKRLETSLCLFRPSTSMINCFNKSLFCFTYCR